MPIALAAAGLLSGILGNIEAQHKQQVTGAMQAAQERSQPFTKQAPQTETAFAPPAGANLLQGGIGGFATGQNIVNAQQSNDVNKQILDALLAKNGGSNGAGAGSSAQWGISPGIEKGLGSPTIYGSPK